MANLPQLDNNYLFHREEYERLRNLLIEDVSGPFCFLDVACGDASSTVDALFPFTYSVVERLFRSSALVRGTMTQS
jgi:hypothetical protein